MVRGFARRVSLPSSSSAVGVGVGVVPEVGVVLDKRRLVVLGVVELSNRFFMCL